MPGPYGVESDSPWTTVTSSYGDAEGVGDDLRHRRLDALTVRRGAEVGDDLPARFDPHRGAFGREGGRTHRARLDVDAAPESEQASVGASCGLLGPELVVAEHLDRLLERLERRDVLEDVAARRGERQVVGSEEVPAPQLDRVDPERPGRVVDRHLARRRLEHPWAAVGALAHGVRPDHGRREPEPGDLVRPGEQERVHDRRARRVCADVGHVLDRDGLDDLVVVDRESDLAVFVARVRRRDEVLAPVLDPLDRSTEESRREHDRALLAEHEHLLAEATADIARVDANVALGDPEVAGEEVPCLVHTLARRRDVDLVAARDPRSDDPAGLHGDAHVAVLLDLGLDDVRARGEHGVEVGRERRERHLHHRVGREAPGPVDDVLGVTRRGHEVDARVAWLDVQLDELACVLGDVSALGDDERDRARRRGGRRCSRAAGAPGAPDRAWRATHRPKRPVEVLGREHSDDARKLARGAHVEMCDRGLRDVAAQERRVERAGGRDVVDVEAVAGQQALVLLAGDRRPDVAGRDGARNRAGGALRCLHAIASRPKSVR